MPGQDSFNTEHSPPSCFSGYCSSCGKRSGPAGMIGWRAVFTLSCQEGRSVPQIANSEKIKFKNNMLGLSYFKEKKQVSYKLAYYYHGDMRGREISRFQPGCVSTVPGDFSGYHGNQN